MALSSSGRSPSTFLLPLTPPLPNNRCPVPARQGYPDETRHGTSVAGGHAPSGQRSPGSNVKHRSVVQEESNMAKTPDKPDKPSSIPTAKEVMQKVAQAE